MRIDVQCHIFPKVMETYMLSNNFPKCFRMETGVVCDFGSQKLIMSDAQYAPENIVKAMDQGKVDISIISANIPDPCFLPPDRASSLCTELNDVTKAIENDANGRFFSYGFLPWNHPEAALTEIDHVAALGMKGIMLFTRNGDFQVDDQRLEVVYDKIEAAGLPVFIHPTVPMWHQSIGDYGMVANCSLVMDTAYAFMRLCYSGILDRHPSMNVVIPHAGGVLPILDGRLGYVPPAVRRFIDPDKRTVLETLFSGQVWFDLANPSKNVLDYFKNYLGLERAMYGSDYPFCEQEFLTGMLEEMEFTQEELEMINWKNANRLFKLGLESFAQ